MTLWALSLQSLQSSGPAQKAAQAARFHVSRPMEMPPPNSRDEVLKLLSDIHAREATYHNHKETSAWAAAAVYAAFVASTLTSSFSTFVSASPCWYAAYVFVLAAIAVRYISIQYRLCRWASACVAATDFVRMEIVSKPNVGFDPTDFGPVPLVGSNGSDLNTWLPKRLHAEVARVQQQGQGARGTLEVLAYLFVVAIAVGGLYRAWGG